MVFLLLIFFMVSTSFTTRTQLAVNLPEAEGVATTFASPLELSIDAAGEFKLNVRWSPPMQVYRYYGPSGTTTRYAHDVAADSRAMHQYVVTALGTARNWVFSN